MSMRKNLIKKMSVVINLDLSKLFNMEDLDSAINEMKIGKVAGADAIFMEFLKHFKLKTKTWLQFDLRNRTTS